VIERRVAWVVVGTGLALFGVMGLLGLTMRLSQAEVFTLSPSWFYRLMTLHGAGMLVGALLAMMGALWFVLRSSVPLDVRRMLAAYAAVVAGAVLVLVAVLVGGFAAGWTFLWPLPFADVGAWRPWATDVFLVGLLFVGAGFMVYCIDLLVQTTGTYGGLQRALGISYLRNRDDDPPPPQAIAAMVVSLEGLIASAVGTTIVVALLGRALDSSVQLDALWAKNLTYFFGHSIANLTIYLGAGAIYALLPRYAGRP
jgi:cytochrome c oxidase subunit 1